MNPHQEKILDLFQRASALPPQRRADFLDRACAQDKAVRNEVDSLLAAHDSAGDFLGVVTIDAPRTVTPPHSDTPAVGTRIGRYRLGHLLGEGGFGFVYHARQEEPVRRDVALKLIKPGMDSRQVIARFEAERQALAILDHPHIARVYDAGTTDAGRPYFVMEYVPGKPITVFCDENRLSISDRLLLFIQACDAIAHAHTKAIIHRDVKASNVLAYMHDGKPTVKVIDFGIAKALRGDRLTDASFNTEQGLVVGTYESMSPEQAEGSADIDTRTDVYSLGVLLYELLTGAKPFDRETLARAADHEIRRIIREVEPPRPSTRLSELGESATKLAQLRQSKLDALARQLRKELEWIPLKAMRKERARRYASPLELSEDIRNYLAGKPLLAGPESRAYRLRKFGNRHWRGVAASAATVMLAAFGITVYINNIRAEQRKTQSALGEAKTQAEIARAVSEFLTGRVLSGASPELLPDKAVRDAIVKAMLEPASLAVASDLRGKPLTEAAVRSSLAHSYHAIGRVDLALPHEQAALVLRRQVLGEDHADTLATMTSLGAMFEAQGELDQADVLLRDAVGRSESVLGHDHPTRLSSMNNLGALLSAQGKDGEAEALYRQVLEGRRRALGHNHRDTVASMNNLACSLQAQEKLEQAEPFFREALQHYRRMLGDDHPSTLSLTNNMAYVLQRQGKLKEAQPLYQDALARRRRVLGDEHPETLRSMSNMASVLADMQEGKEAERIYRDTLARRRRVLGNDHPDTLTSIHNLGDQLRAGGGLDEAEALWREALAGRRQALGDDHPDTLHSINNLGDLLTAQKKPDKAEPLRRELVERCRRLLGDTHANTLTSMNNLGKVLYMLGKREDAERLFREALMSATASDSLGRQHPFTKRFAANHADCLDLLGRHDEAAAVRKEFGVPPTTRPATAAATSPATQP